MFIFIVQISAQMHNFITSIYSSAIFRDVKHNSSFNLKRKIHWGFTASWKSWWGVRQGSISCKSRFICLIEAWQQQKYLLPLKTRKVKACVSMQKSSDFVWFLDTCWTDFASILEIKMHPKWGQKWRTCVFDLEWLV